MRIIRFLAISLFALIAFDMTAPSLSAQNKSDIDKDLPYLLAFYKYAHQHPELSLKEEATSRSLAEELRKIGFEVTDNFGGHGVVGVLRNGEGPQILYRTDMDALPVKENTGLPYASQVETELDGVKTGVMHACGHDMHMTTWLGVARRMASDMQSWKGTFIMIAQPAEEIGAGAQQMLDFGLYKKFGVPDYAIGLHCNAQLAAGEVGFGKGFTMATAESIDIKVFGIGAHGAAPHMSIDPIVLASTIVLELQTIVSRNLNPAESAVITVGSMHGGTKNNIIPDDVMLKLTVRTFSEDVRQMVHRRILEVTRGTAIAAGLPEDKMPQVVFPENYVPANYNNPELVDKLRSSAEAVVGAEKIKEVGPEMVAEDFGRYTRTDDRVPSVLFWLGTVPQERIDSGDKPGLHSARYYPDPEPSIRTGVLVTTQMLVDLFKG